MENWIEIISDKLSDIPIYLSTLFNWQILILFAHNILI